MRDVGRRPESVVGNWEAEFHKWIGPQCGVKAVKDFGRDFGEFRKDASLRVLIISYETFRIHVEEVQDIGFHMVVADEAHRRSQGVTTALLANPRS